MKRELSPETAATPYVAELRRLFWETEALMVAHLKPDLEATQVALTSLEETLELAESSVRLGLAVEWPAVEEEPEEVIEEETPRETQKRVLTKGKKR